MLPYIARPLYHSCGSHYLSEKASWVGQSSVGMTVLTGHVVSSILPDAFNTLLTNALNHDDAEGKVTHFVMLHGDIAPQDGWLSILLSEMEATGVDVLSAVVPIKIVDADDTSTAVGVLDGRRTHFRRLTTADALALPETFTGSDVCSGDEKLLINTGLMAIDLRKPWIEDWMDTGGFRFETHSWRDPGQERKSICLPEDWLFSWDVQMKFCAKVAATTKVRLVHYGEAGFANRYPRKARTEELQEAA